MAIHDHSAGSAFTLSAIFLRTSDLELLSQNFKESICGRAPNSHGLPVEPKVDDMLHTQ
jgi:hypothetical protein